jgi:hypothetical protein
MARSVVVEERMVVREKLPWEGEERENTEGSQAVTTPPREPSVSRFEKPDR